MLFSYSSFGNWILVDTQKNGDQYYYDNINIRKDNGYIYFWRLVSIKTPTKEGIQSGAFYRQGDCSIFRLKNLFFVGYSGPVATGEILLREKENKDWEYPQPKSVDDNIMKIICSK